MRQQPTILNGSGRSRVRIAVTVMLALGMLASSCAPQPRQRPRARRVAARPVPAPPAYPAAYPVYIPWGEHTVDSRLAELGTRVRPGWRRSFADAGLAYPPHSVVLVTFKRERRVDVFAGPSRYDLALVRSVAVTAASGGPGPKLREGDRQVPEGIYEVASLNPNSAFHVALRLAYPNVFDQRMGNLDRRRRLGSDIMIHGGHKSVGCVAVGDEAAEGLFVIAADAGIENVSVLIVPRDFRRTGETEPMPGQPKWVADLYADLDSRLRALPAAAPIAARATSGPLRGADRLGERDSPGSAATSR